MKILHVCTSGEYTEGFSYQDNLLTKYMVKQGWDVYLIASPLAFDEKGKTIRLPVPQSYVNADGVKVTRLPYKKPDKVGHKLRSMDGFYEKLEEIAPDVIYIHLPQIYPFLYSSCTVALGLCWKAGVAAEVIGVPRGSIGEALYNAKIYLNTVDLFAWTVLIVLLSIGFEKLFLLLLKGLRKGVERL